MFIDTSAPGGPGGEPWLPSCKSCTRTIGPNEKIERIRFEAHDADDLQRLNGIYHPACAAPILSVKRAYDMMNRLRG